EDRSLISDTSTPRSYGRDAHYCIAARSETTGQLYWRCWKLCWWRTIKVLLHFSGMITDAQHTQLALVYFLEYVILPGCAAKVNPGAANSHKWAVKHAYVVLSFCYQFGVLISRSSLSFVRITWVEVLTVLQVRL